MGCNREFDFEDVAALKRKDGVAYGVSGSAAQRPEETVQANQLAGSNPNSP